MWIAYPCEIDSVTIIAKGTAGRVFKRGSKPKDPYVVFDGDEEFVVGSGDLFDSPVAAGIASAKIAQAEKIDCKEEEDESSNPIGDEDDEDDEGDEGDEDDEDDEGN